MVIHSFDKQIIKENPKGNPQRFKLTIGMRILMQAAFMALIWILYQLYKLVTPDFQLPVDLKPEQIQQTSNGHNVKSMIASHKAFISDAFSNPLNEDLDSVITSVAKQAAEDLFSPNDTEKKVICAFVRRDEFEFDEMFKVGASMGYYEYTLFEGKYMLIIKYAAQDNEYRLEESIKITEDLRAQS